MATGRVLIEGIGGIGGVMAGQLLRAGHDVTLVTGNPEIAAAIGARGLRVRALGQDFVARGTAVARVADLPAGARYDVALLVMKANRVVEAARDTLPVLADDGYLVTCQNGIVEDAVSAVAGADRVVSAIVGWGGTLHAPGDVERTGPGAIHLGELDGSVGARVRALAQLLAATGRVVVTDNILGALWSKLAINCTITSAGALTGQTLGALLGARRARDAFLGVYSEVIDTALALGVRLERIATDPMLLYLPRDAGALRRALKDLVVHAVGLRYRRLKSSSLQSLERGRPTEVDFLNGYVVQQAHRVDVQVPLNAALTRMIHEIERGDRPLSPANLDALVASSSLTSQ